MTKNITKKTEPKEQPHPEAKSVIQTSASEQRLSRVKGLSRDRIEEMRSQLSLLREFVAKVMIRGEHYGVIPGFTKPTLLKAGAEFLREAYGFEVRSQCVEKKFVASGQRGPSKEYIEYTYRVELFLNGVSVGVCEGSCNNYERRYEKSDPFTVMNTIQKMAQKRAYVGAVISATRSSNIFTQDIEDEPELVAGRGNADIKMATPAQAKLIWARLKNELKLSDLAAREFISKNSGKTHSRELTSADVEILLSAIEQNAVQESRSAS